MRTGLEPVDCQRAGAAAEGGVVKAALQRAGLVGAELECLAVDGLQCALTGSDGRVERRLRRRDVDSEGLRRGRDALVGVVDAPDSDGVVALREVRVRSAAVRARRRG